MSKKNDDNQPIKAQTQCGRGDWNLSVELELNEKILFVLAGPQNYRLVAEQFLYYPLSLEKYQHSFLRKRQFSLFSAIKRSRFWEFWRKLRPEKLATIVVRPENELESNKDCNLVSKSWTVRKEWHKAPVGIVVGSYQTDNHHRNKSLKGSSRIQIGYKRLTGAQVQTKRTKTPITSKYPSLGCPGRS